MRLIDTNSFEQRIHRMWKRLIADTIKSFRIISFYSLCIELDWLKIVPIHWFTLRWDGLSNYPVYCSIGCCIWTYLYFNHNKVYIKALAIAFSLSIFCILVYYIHKWSYPGKNTNWANKVSVSMRSQYKIHLGENYYRTNGI